MTNNFFEEMSKIYESILLQEKLVDIFHNAALPLIRYFRCKRGESTSEICPKAIDVLNSIKQWLKVNPDHPYAQRVAQLVNIPDDPEKILTNLRYNLEYVR